MSIGLNMSIETRRGGVVLSLPLSRTVTNTITITGTATITNTIMINVDGAGVLMMTTA